MHPQHAGLKRPTPARVGPGTSLSVILHLIAPRYRNKKVDVKRNDFPWTSCRRTRNESSEKESGNRHGHFLPNETLPEQEQEHWPLSFGVDLSSPALVGLAVLDPLPPPPLFAPPLIESKSDSERRSFRPVSASEDLLAWRWGSH